MSATDSGSIPQAQAPAQAQPLEACAMVELPTDPLRPGAMFGGYRILSSLGSGDVEDVWLALLRTVGGEHIKVVLKTLLPDLSADPQVGSLALHESFLAAQIGASGMARLFDCGIANGLFYQGLEYVRGRNLRQVVTQCRRRGETLPPWVVLRTAVALCQQLEEIQRSGDVAREALGRFHRRLVPERVLLTFEGEVRFLGCDLGLATAATRAGNTTRVESLIDSLAPEWHPEQRFEGSYDVFYIGALLYELLTGTPAEVASLRKQGPVADDTPPPRPPSSLAPWIPVELDQIILRALAVRPQDRYPSPAELGAALEGLLQQHGDAHGPQELGMIVSSLFPPSTPAARISNLDLSAGVTDDYGDGAAASLDRVESLLTGGPSGAGDPAKPGARPQICAREDGTTFAVRGFSEKDLRTLLEAHQRIPFQKPGPLAVEQPAAAPVGQPTHNRRGNPDLMALNAGGTSWLKRMYRPLFGRRMRSSGSHPVITDMPTPPPSTGTAGAPEGGGGPVGPLEPVPTPPSALPSPEPEDTVARLWRTASRSPEMRTVGATGPLDLPELPQPPGRWGPPPPLTPPPIEDLDARIAASWGTLPEVIQPDITEEIELIDMPTETAVSPPDIFQVRRPGKSGAMEAVPAPRIQSGEVAIVTGPAPRSDAEVEAAKRFDQGLRELRSGDYQAAYGAWRAAVQLQPDNRIYRSNLRRIAKLLDEPVEEPPA